MHPKKLAVVLFLGAGLLSGASFADQIPSDRMQTYASDAIVSHKVMTALHADKSLHAEDIRVSAHYGTVLLSGYVRSDVELVEAVDVAQAVIGVYDVRSDLLLKGQLKS